MARIAALALVAFVSVARIFQTPAPRIELPALDRSVIAFRVDAQPAQVLSQSNVPGAFFGVPNQAARLTDGRILLATPWGFSRLHVVDSAGRALVVGDFNGRMGSIQNVCTTSDDRIVVFHDRAKFTVFTSSGGVVASGARPDPSEVLCPAAPDLRVWVQVVTATGFAPSPQPHDPSITARRTDVALRRLDLQTGAGVTDLGSLPSLDYYPTGPMSRIPTRDPSVVLYGWSRRPFGRELAVGVERERIHTGDGTSWDIRTWNASGQLIRTLHVNNPPDPVTPEMRAAFIDEYFAGNSPGYREKSITQQRLADASIFPTTVPAFGRTRVARNGSLWVQRYPRPLQSITEWWVFTSDARYLGRVDLPAAFAIEDIGDDYVLGNYLTHKAVRPENDAIMDRSTYEVRLYRLTR